jgi:hypothetical protein
LFSYFGMIVIPAPSHTSATTGMLLKSTAKHYGNAASGGTSKAAPVITYKSCNAAMTPGCQSMMQSGITCDSQDLWFGQVTVSPQLLASASTGWCGTPVELIMSHPQAMRSFSVCTVGRIPSGG